MGLLKIDVNVTAEAILSCLIAELLLFAFLPETQGSKTGAEEFGVRLKSKVTKMSKNNPGVEQITQITGHIQNEKVWPFV